MAGNTISKRDKVFFPSDQITKGDLADYYSDLAKPFVTYAKGRAVTLRRFPDGINEDGFFQKNTPDYFPSWFPTATLPTDQGRATYPMVTSKRALLYAVDQGTIEFHTALSKTDKPDLPDRLVFDLDPSDDNFDKVRRVAILLQRALDKADVPAFAMTTGSSGLHVVVPLRRTRQGHFDAVRALARKVAQRIAEEQPDLATIAQRKAKRDDRVFVDYLRNAYGQTSVAPFSVRAKPGAPIAVPVSWPEVRSQSLSPNKYTIANVKRRLSQQREDPWARFGSARTTYTKIKNNLPSRS